MESEIAPRHSRYTSTVETYLVKQQKRGVIHTRENHVTFFCTGDKKQLEWTLVISLICSLDPLARGPLLLARGPLSPAEGERVKTLWKLRAYLDRAVGRLEAWEDVLEYH